MIGEIVDEIKNREKLSKKFIKTKLCISKCIYIAARFKVKRMILNKKRAFSEKNLTESIGKPKRSIRKMNSFYYYFQEDVGKEDPYVES